MNRTQCLTKLLAVATLMAALVSPVIAATYSLRGYGTFTESGPPSRTPAGATLRRFTFGDVDHAKIFASKLYSDFELTSGNRIEPIASKRGVVDVVALAGGGYVMAACSATTPNVAIVVAPDRPALIGALDSELSALPLRRAALAHPLYMDKWDRYPLGVWQGIGDFAQNPTDNTVDSFYKWMSDVAINPQFNMGRYTIDGAVNDNVFAWQRSYYAKYGLKYQFVEWLINQPDLYNRNPFLSSTANPHVASRWSYYGETRLGTGALRDVQNATYAGILKNVDADQNMMAILDPDGEIGPFGVDYWGASGPALQREFVRFLREVRKLSLDDVSLRYTGKAGAYKGWDDVTLADWRDFYGWSNGAVDLAGEWRILRDDKLEAYASGWALPTFDDSDWVRLYYPGDSLVYSLVSGGKPLWMRKTVTVNRKAFAGPIYLSLAPLSGQSVQVFINGRPAGSLDPRFHTAHTWGQFDVTDDVAKNATLTLALKFAGGDEPNGPVFLTSKKVEDFPTSDPILNARRWDHLEFVDWASAQGVGSTLSTIRSIDPNRPIKVHANSGSPWGWTSVAKYGGFSHHTGSGPGWNYTEPRQLGLSRDLQDSSETGGPVDNLRDLKGLFGNLIYMGKNAHDYFISVLSISKDPAMKAWFTQKVPAIKVMGRANVLKSPIAVIDAQLGTRYQGEFAHWESWRFGVNPGKGGEMVPFLDEIRIREGNLNGNKVIIDPGYESWDDEETAALRTYVTNGGVLVLNQLSGRSTFLRRGNGDGPGCKLAGVRFGAQPVNSRAITFAGSDSVLAGAIGAVGVESRYGEPPVALVPDAGTTVLATWPDGTAAVTKRQIGTGSVYYLGTSVYPQKMISPFVDAYGPGVYATATGGFDLLRTLQSNNGCEDLIMVRGLGNKPTNITWTFDYKPTGIYDPVTGKPIDAKIDGNTATFTVTIDDWDFQWYASRRPSAPDSVSHWLNRQTQIWSGVTPPSVTPQPAVYRHLDLNKGWKMVQTDTIDAAKALMNRDDKAAGLVPTILTLWNAPASTATKPTSAALYRRDFDLPAEWNRESTFSLAVRGQIHDCPIHGMTGKNEIFLNGVSIWSGNKLDTQYIDVVPNPLPAHNRLEIVHEGNGIMPSVMLVRSAKPDSVIDLAGEWKAVSDQHTEAPATVPGPVTASFIYRDILIPESARGKEIWFRANGNCPNVMVNGRVRYWDMNGPTTFTPSPNLEIDVTPDIRFGKVNRIAIGSSMFNGWHPTRLTFNSVELAAYAPGKWSPDGKGTRTALTAKELVAVERDLSTVQAYPLVRPAVAKKAPVMLTAASEAIPLVLPTPIVDIDMHPEGAVAKDRGPNAFPLTIKGNVEPITEGGGKIAGVYIHGEGPNAGSILIPQGPFRRHMDGKPLTMRFWVKPIAINRGGGALASWIDYNFNWGIGDSTTAINLNDPPGRKLIAQDVIRQRDWQSLTLVLDGVKGTLYVDGIAVGVQTWNRSMPSSDAPFSVGSMGGIRDYFNGKIAAFTIYPGAMTADDVAKLYLKEKPGFTVDVNQAGPEKDIFRLAIDGDTVKDGSEIPVASMETAGLTVRRDDGAPYVSFSGDKSYITARDHPRARNYAAPFSLVWEMRREAGAGGMIFRHHHIICLGLNGNGTLDFDANIGRNNRATFPNAVPAGKWVRMMLTYDGHTVCVYRDGEKLGEKAYPGALAPSDFPIAIFVDNTNRFPTYGNIKADVREYRLIDGILTKMPEPAPMK
ncbi:MAG TPA: LamG-like jellyroll fold domain-containing protein [Capsulimonadaceae bacterium]|jgi:hypothetical protein